MSGRFKVGSEPTGTGRVIGRLLVAVGTVVIACSCWQRTQEAEHDEVAAVVRLSMQQEITAYGSVTPQVGAEVKIGPRVSGVLEILAVGIGDQVEKGQMLAELRHEELDAAVRQAATRAREAAAKVELAQAIARRRSRLLAAGLIAEEERDLAVKEFDMATAALESLQLDLEQARIKRGYATIRAPISGTVTSVATQVGETVAASFAVPTFVTIIDLNRLEVTALVDEVDIGKIHTGQAVSFQVDAFPQEQFTGAVRAVSPAAVIDDRMVSYKVLIDITSENRSLLKPGMTASIVFPSPEMEQVLAVPTTAILRDDQGRPYVLVTGTELGRQRDGEAPPPRERTKRPVFLGGPINGMTRVLSGLNEGEQVLVPRSDQLEGDAS